MLLLLSISVVYAEAKNIFIPPSNYAYVSTWQDGQHGDSENRDSGTLYFQSLHGRGWSSNNGWHIVSQSYVQAYNANILEMPGTGPLIGSGGYVTTLHNFNDNPPSGGNTYTYTSHDGAHSTNIWFYCGSQC